MPGAQQWKRGVDQPCESERGLIHRAAELICGRADRAATAGMTADEDQSIEPAEGASRGGDRLNRRSLVSKIAETFRGHSAFRLDLRRRGVKAGCVRARVKQQRGAGRRKQFCGGATDAAGCASDEIDTIDTRHHDIVVAGGSAPVRWK